MARKAGDSKTSPVTLTLHYVNISKIVCHIYNLNTYYGTISHDMCIIKSKLSYANMFSSTMGFDSTKKIYLV